ncbi:MAG: hypothetical protein FWD44_00580 [Oscillospiraceae bacterium]|nr:hypothetical protein [Oscillospiraceae bacterium]
MRDEYDFSDAKRENPYAEKILQNGYAIIINCGAAQNNSDDVDISSVDAVAEHKTPYKR